MGVRAIPVPGSPQQLHIVSVEGRLRLEVDPNSCGIVEAEKLTNRQCGFSEGLLDKRRSRSGCPEEQDLRKICQKLERV